MTIDLLMKTMFHSLSVAAFGLSALMIGAMLLSYKLNDQSWSAKARNAAKMVTAVYGAVAYYTLLLFMAEAPLPVSAWLAVTAALPVIILGDVLGLLIYRYARRRTISHTNLTLEELAKKVSSPRQIRWWFPAGVGLILLAAMLACTSDLTLTPGPSQTAAPATGEAPTQTAPLAPISRTITVASTCLVAFDGDSITRGLGTSLNHSFPFQVVEQLEQLGYGRCLRVNLGVDAQTIANMSTDAAATDAFYNGSLRRNVIVVFAGTNDLYFGATATDTYNALVSYCQARQTTGWEVVVVTMLPRSSAGTPAGFETARGTVNGNIRSNWRTFADAIADIAADGRIGDSGDELDTTYYNADKVHLVDAGHDVVTEHVRNAIMTLIATQ